MEDKLKRIEADLARKDEEMARLKEENAANLASISHQSATADEQVCECGHTYVHSWIHACIFCHVNCMCNV